MRAILVLVRHSTSFGRSYMKASSVTHRYKTQMSLAQEFGKKENWTLLSCFAICEEINGAHQSNNLGRSSRNTHMNERRNVWGRQKYKSPTKVINKNVCVIIIYEFLFVYAKCKSAFFPVTSASREIMKWIVVHEIGGTWAVTYCTVTQAFRCQLQRELIINWFRGYINCLTYSPHHFLADKWCFFMLLCFSCHTRLYLWSLFAFFIKLKTW